MNISVKAWSLVVALGLCKCNCSADSGFVDAGPPMAQIDVCFSPEVGASEVCYEDLKRSTRDENCNEQGVCVLPELTADLGTITATETSAVTVTVKSTGSIPLRFHNPSSTPGSSQRYRIREAQSTGADSVFALLEPGEEFKFTIELRGTDCGPQDAFWKLGSNDGQATAGQLPLGYRRVPPDSPITLNLKGFVKGACLCPKDGGTVNFGGVIVGERPVKRFEFSSCGDEPLTLDPSGDSSGLGRNPRDVFEIVQQSFSRGDVLQPGDGATIDLRYSPNRVAPPGDAAELWIYSNSASAQPYLPIFIEGTGLRRPSCRLTAMPHELNFGSDSASRTFRIVNEGELTCRVFEVERTVGPASFTAGAGGPPPDITLAPGRSFQLTINYDPSGGDEEHAEFEVRGDDVNGTVSEALIRAHGNLPERDGCDLEIDPAFGDFGEVSVGESEQIAFILSNIGGGNLFGGSCRISDVQLVRGAPDFRLGDFGQLVDFMGIMPGGFFDGSLPVTFEPQSEGVKTGILRFFSNDPVDPFIDVQLWGSALGAKLCVAIAGSGTAQHECGVEQPCDKIDFGSLAPGAVSYKDVTLTNCGAGILTLRGLELSPTSVPQFSLESPPADQLPVRLFAGQTQSLQLRYIASSVDGDFGVLNILSNAENAQAARIDLRGNYSGDCEAILRCSPEFLNFGSVADTSSDTRTVVCSNFGTAEVVVDNVYISGDPALNLLSDPFGIVPPGGNFNVQIACSPAVAGAFSATVSVISSACERSPITLTANCDGYFDAPPACVGSDTFSPVEKWRWTGSPQYPGFDDVWSTPIVINLSDDNFDGNIDALDTPDVIFTALQSSMEFGPSGGMEEACNSNNAQPAIVVAVSGDDGRELWAWGLPPSRQNPGDLNAKAMESEAQLAAADIDGDGFPEIIGVTHTFIPPPENCDSNDFECCLRTKFNHGTLTALEHDGTFKWRSETWHMSDNNLENGGGPSIGDMDGDGFPEISFGNAVFDHNGTLLFEGDTPSSEGPGHGEGGAGHGPISVFVDLTGDGNSELLAGRTAFDVNGTVVWDRTDLADGLATIANVDIDESPEIILLNARNDLLVLEHTGVTKYGPFRIHSGADFDEDGVEDGFIATHPALGDLDGDGLPEIVISASGLVHVFDIDPFSGLTEKWTMPISDQTGASGPTTFDFEGDGFAEVVYADEQYVYIWDGTNGFEKYRAPRGSRTIFDNPVVADIDNDNHADIVLAMESPSAALGMYGVIAYSNHKNNWVGTRRIWNQHAYHITNISESGSVPVHEGRGWLQHNAYRSNVVVCR